MGDIMDEEMRRQLSCSVCLELYTDPVLLPCLHSLCLECVNSLQSASISLCPECKASIRSYGNMVDIKRNFPLNNLVQIYKQAQTARTRPTPTRNIYPDVRSFSAGPQQTTVSNQAQQTTVSDSKQCSTCDAGSTSPAAIYCRTCTMSFCSGCLDSLHPKGTDHEFVSVADVGKIKLCVICESSATDECLECKMAFCPSCLVAYHPTTTSSPGHTLVKATVRVSSYQLTSKDTPPPLPPRRRSHIVPPSPKQVGMARSASQGDFRPRTSGSKQGFSSLQIARDVREATRERHCSLCAHGQRVEASFRCLDCSVSICRSCIFYHRQDAPSHTVINIALPGVQEQQQQTRHLQQQQQQRPNLQLQPVQNNDLQMRLVELMETKSSVMEELLEALSVRNVSEI